MLTAALPCTDEQRDRNPDDKRHHNASLHRPTITANRWCRRGVAAVAALEIPEVDVVVEARRDGPFPSGENAIASIVSL